MKLAAALVFASLALAPIGAWAQAAPAPATGGDAAPPTEDVPTEVEPIAPSGTAPTAEPATGGVVTGVILQGLDKVSARTSSIEVPLDGSASFGTLTIRARQCITAPPDEKPETSAFLEIADTPPGQDAVPLFSGWMFASSPALSALEHPVYDVWVIACRTSVPGKP